MGGAEPRPYEKDGSFCEQLSYSLKINWGWAEQSPAPTKYTVTSADN